STLQPQLSICTNTEETSGGKNIEERVKINPFLNCSIGTCLRVTCDIRAMGVGTSVTFTISGAVSKAWSQRTELRMLSIQSSAELVYDGRRFQHILEQDTRFVRAQVKDTSRTG
ncbi:hypothetical protein GDO81_026706, partial [Engystomops pustulosus]